ncbi:acyltransferase family protein, partial [Citrobacter freundii]
VLLVLLFHVGFSSISGGFVGVDIFFVISGYLITGILVSGMERGTYKYSTFIASRISRLYPTLLSILIICLLLGFLIFTPNDYKELGISSLYSALSISNFHFMLGAGYFDTSSEINPLLHTWSLSVEQQFYLIWPIIILAAMKSGRKLAISLIVIAGVISLIASQMMTKINPTQNYFMMPYRIFEFAAGGVLFFIPNEKARNKLISTILFLSGAALIFYSAFYFDKSTPFPGLNAMIPVMGSCLCILFSKHTPAGYLLRNKLFVSIGIVSYSVYLIHWPVLVFYKYYVFRPINTFEKLSIVVISVLLAYVSYAFIENKFRRINLYSFNKMGVNFAVVLVVVLLASNTIYK